LGWINIVNEEVIKQKQDIIEYEKALHGFEINQNTVVGDVPISKTITKKTEEKIVRGMGFKIIKKRRTGQATVIK